MSRCPDRCARRATALALAAALAVTGCTDDGPGRSDELAQESGGPTPGALPTIPGGVELPVTDPRAVLVGADLAFGTPLPSEQLAANGFTAHPEVTSAQARRVYVAGEGRRLGDALVLTIDGRQLFDEAALATFERALVGAIAGAEATDLPLAGRPALQAVGGAMTAVGFRQGDLLTVVTGPVAADVVFAVTRQIEAIGRGEIGGDQPFTPLGPLPPDAAFVPVPTVTFAPILPVEDEPVSPEVPRLPGSTDVQGRYGVVGGERRTVVWAFSVDRGTYPSAEVLDAALPGLVASRAGGAQPEPAEIIDRVVLASTNPLGTRSARVFRHHGLALLVEGDRPDQLDAVVTAWITALGPS
ncbi:MAG: hypothetical protein ABWZ76_07385 [Acidimicrobiales bacterium]